MTNQVPSSAPQAARCVTVFIFALMAAGLCACRQDPRVSSRKFLDSGTRLEAAGKTSDAIVEYGNAVQAEPLSREAHEKLAEALLRQGDLRSSLPEYVRAADLATNDSKLQVRVGNLLLASGFFDEAKAHGAKVLATDARNVDAQILVANALAGLKNVDGAVDQVEDALRIDPTRSDSYSALGYLELRRGKREAAEQAFRKAVALDEHAVAPRLALANFCWSVGNLPAAEDSFNGARGLEPGNALTNRTLANFYLATNRPAQAEQPLKKVFEVTNTRESAIALIDFYIATKNEQAARRLLTPMLNDPRSIALAHLRLAGLDYRAGRHEDALKGLTVVLEKDPASLDALLLRSAILLADGKTDDALLSARTAADRHPTSTSALFVLGRVQVVRHQVDDAIHAFEQVLRLNPRATAAKVALAQLQLTAGHADTSAALAAEALGNEPDNADAQLAHARGLLRRGELDRAAPELKQLSTRFPQSAIIQAETGILLGMKHEYGAARGAFEQALQIQPDNMEALDGIVALDLAMKDYARARARVDARMAIVTTAPTLTWAAKTYAATGDMAGAERLLRRALDIDSSFMTAYELLGTLYVQQGKLTEARARFQAIADRSPKPVPALTMMAIITLAQGDVASAREQFERVLQVDPEAAVAANNLAWIYATNNGNLDMALQFAQTAKRHLPELAAVDDTLGFIYYKKNLVALAVSALRSSAERMPTNALYQYHLGLAYAKAGDAARARESLTRALKLDRSFDGAVEARAALSALPLP